MSCDYAGLQINDQTRTSMIGSRMMQPMRTLQRLQTEVQPLAQPGSSLSERDLHPSLDPNTNSIAACRTSERVE